MCLLRAFALFIVAVVGWSVPQSALADTPWRTMHANTYAATAASARAQCEREVGSGHVPGLTLEKCALLERKLEGGQCTVSNVSAGQRYHVVAGVGPDRVHQLNFSPRTLICALGDGVVAHWFTGEDRSCNNVGFAKPPAPPPTPVCVWVETEPTITPGSSFHVPDIAPCGCEIPGVSGTVPPSVNRNFVRICK